MSAHWWIIIGVVIGWLVAGWAMRKRGARGAEHGALVDIFVAIGGATVGLLTMRTLGLHFSRIVYTVVAAILGAVILAILVRAIRKV